MTESLTEYIFSSFEKIIEQNNQTNEGIYFIIGTGSALIVLFLLYKLVKLFL